MPKIKAKPMPISDANLDYSEFGKTLKILIKAKGYTQANFAEAIGVAYPTMLNILQGSRRIYLHTYLKIIDVLDISDIVILNKTIPDDELLENAKLYTELLSLLGKVPKSTLQNFIGLAKELADDNSTDK